MHLDEKTILFTIKHLLNSCLKVFNLFSNNFFALDNTEIRFSLGSTSEAEAEMAFQEVENLFNGSSRSLSYKGMPLRFSDSCGLQVNNNCRGTTTTSAVIRCLWLCLHNERISLLFSKVLTVQGKPHLNLSNP